MRTYELIAPAKINLSLRVLARRDDGFHDIDSLMVPISLADRLLIEVGGDGVRIEVPGHPELGGQENLCAKAARSFEEHLRVPVSLRVILEKRIPIAGGLGGGSSDAAAVLRCLAHHHGVVMDDPRLQAAALAVGSDVPFFVRGTPAIASGRGEQLREPPHLPHPFHLVILRPPFGVSAREAYETLAALRAGGSKTTVDGREPDIDPEGRSGQADRSWERASLGSAGELAASLQNDLEEAVEQLHPILEYKSRLLDAGTLGALMSGSGSCFFGIAESVEAAGKAAASIRIGPNEVVFTAHSLQRTPDLRETSRQPGSTPTSI